MAIPEEIKKFKPEGLDHACEIRFLGGKYYVYEISSRWNAEKNRPQKTTGKCIGKINAKDGFIPNANYMNAYHYKQLRPYSRNYGAIEMFRQLGRDIEESLRIAFPDIWREIIVVSLLSLVYESTGKELKYDFEHSVLCDLYPDIGTCPESLGGFMDKLGTRSDDMEAFMKSFLKDGHKLLFDGTSIFCSSSDTCISPGYNSAHSRDGQYRLLYVFDRNSMEPVFYRLVPGWVVDKAAFKETIRRLGPAAAGCTIIADKGFYSKQNASYLEEAGLSYILPLQYNTSLIPKAFDEEESDRRFDGRFTYKGRLIWYKVEGLGRGSNRLYIYKDEKRAADAGAAFTERQEKGYGNVEKGNGAFFKDKRRGIFSFISNTGLDAKEVYLDYKERRDIENCFDYMKNNIATRAGYTRTNEQLESTRSINHIATLYFYRLIRALDAAGLRDRYTPADIIKHGRNITKISEWTGWKNYTEITKDDIELFNRLGVNLLA